MDYYVEIDRDGKKYERQIKKGADYQLLSSYGNKRINDGLISAFYFEKKKVKKKKANRTEYKKQWNKERFKQITTYLAIDEYEKMKATIGEQSVTAYIRELVLKDIGGVDI